MAKAKRKLEESTPVDDASTQALAVFYSTHKPDFANREKCERICRSMMGKASRLPRSLPPEQRDWKLLLRKKLGEQYGIEPEL